MSIQRDGTTVDEQRQVPCTVASRIGCDNRRHRRFRSGSETRRRSAPYGV